MRHTKRQVTGVVFLTSLGLYLAMTLATEGTASATHKSWVLKNSGADCTFEQPDPSDQVSSGILVNYSAVPRRAICPVALSGRWGRSNSPVFPPPRWGSAMSANVYVDKPSYSLFCWAVGQTYDGSFYYSDIKWADPGTTAPETIAIASQSNWGGSLEAQEWATLQSLDVVCNLPDSGARIFGYKVKICQWQSGCNDGNADHDAGLDFTEGQETYVQTSGIECSPARNSDDGTMVTRSVYGITNVSSNWAEVICPISPPADDSYEHPRQVTDTRVYYTGGARYAGCPSDGTCPVCSLSWTTRNSSGPLSSTIDFGEAPFLDYDFSRGALSQPPGAFPTKYELSAQMKCWLQPGTTINGITAVMSLTRISGGV